MKPSDIELEELARAAGYALLAVGRRVVTAESCTGGWLAKAFTDIAGSSRWFERGYVTYSDAAKRQELGVESALLDARGAVSREVVLQMAHGALRVSAADIAIAISGVAGPDGGTAAKPVGLVWFGLAERDRQSRAEQWQFPGGREAVRRAAVAKALALVAAVANNPVAP